MVMACLENQLNRKKLDPIFKGPYKIVDRTSENIYEIKIGSKNERWFYENRQKKRC